MRRLALAWLLAAGVACTGSGTATVGAGATQAAGDQNAVAEPALVSTAGLEEMPSRTYRAAFDQAQKDITVDNAAERLRALEHEIDLDAQSLP